MERPAMDPHWRNAAILFGLALGTVVDGVLRHRLAWRAQTAWGADFFSPATLPIGTPAVLSAGVPPLVVVALALAGGACWARANAAGQRVSPRRFVGLLLIAWGAFRVIGGAIGHHLEDVRRIGVVAGGG